MSYKYICSECSREIKVFTLEIGEWMGCVCHSSGPIPAHAQYFDEPQNIMFHKSELKYHIIAYFRRIQPKRNEEVFSFKVDIVKIMIALGAKNESEIKIVEKELAYACVSIRESLKANNNDIGLNEYQFLICLSKKAQYDVEIEILEEYEKQAEDRYIDEVAETLPMTVEPSELPMGWYNFVTYIQCPFGIIMSILWMLYNINNYGELIFTVFYLFHALLAGILMYGLYKKTIWSWKLLLGFYIFDSIFARIDYLEVLQPLRYLVIIIVLNIVLTIPSYVYFNKRKHLFVN